MKLSDWLTPRSGQKKKHGVIVDKETLSQKSKLCDLKEIPRGLIARMKQFVKYNRGVSAIQFGAPLCIIAVKHNGEVIVMINPEIIERRGCVSMRETCLSCPGIREVVERPTDVTVTYFTEDAVFAEKKFTLPTARVIAHEMEHLDGITLYDRRTV